LALPAVTLALQRSLEKSWSDGPRGRRDLSVGTNAPRRAERSRDSRWHITRKTRASAVGASLASQEFASPTSKAEMRAGSQRHPDDKHLSWGLSSTGRMPSIAETARPRGTEDLIIFLLRAPLGEAPKRATSLMVCVDPGRVTVCPGPVLRAAPCEVSGLSPHSQHGAAPSCLPQLRCAVRIDDPDVAGEPCSFRQRSPPDQRPVAA